MKNFCENCGKEIVKDTLWCQYCGKRLRYDLKPRIITLFIGVLFVSLLGAFFYFKTDIFKVNADLSKNITNSPGASLYTQTISPTDNITIEPTQTLRQESYLDYGLVVGLKYSDFIQKFNSALDTVQNGYSATKYFDHLEINSTIPTGSSVRNQLNKDISLSVWTIGETPYIQKAVLIGNKTKNDVAFAIVYTICLSINSPSSIPKEFTEGIAKKNYSYSSYIGDINYQLSVTPYTYRLEMDYIK